MKIRLKLFGTLRNLAGHEQDISLSENSRVSDLIDLLIRQHGVEFGERLKHREIWQVSINGHIYSLSAAVEKELSDGDEVALLPLISGG